MLHRKQRPMKMNQSSVFRASLGSYGSACLGKPTITHRTHCIQMRQTLYWIQRRVAKHILRKVLRLGTGRDFCQSMAGLCIRAFKQSHDIECMMGDVIFVSGTKSPMGTWMFYIRGQTSDDMDYSLWHVFLHFLLTSTAQNLESSSGLLRAHCKKCPMSDRECSSMTRQAVSAGSVGFSKCEGVDSI